MSKRCKESDYMLNRLGAKRILVIIMAFIILVTTFPPISTYAAEYQYHISHDMDSIIDFDPAFVGTLILTYGGYKLLVAILASAGILLSMYELQTGYMSRALHDLSQSTVNALNSLAETNHVYVETQAGSVVGVIAMSQIALHAILVDVQQVFSKHATADGRSLVREVPSNIIGIHVATNAPLVMSPSRLFSWYVYTMGGYRSDFHPMEFTNIHAIANELSVLLPNEVTLGGSTFTVDMYFRPGMGAFSIAEWRLVFLRDGARMWTHSLSIPRAWGLTDYDAIRIEVMPLGFTLVRSRFSPDYRLQFYVLSWSFYSIPTFGDFYVVRPYQTGFYLDYLPTGIVAPNSLIATLDVPNVVSDIAGTMDNIRDIAGTYDDIFILNPASALDLYNARVRDVVITGEVTTDYPNGGTNGGGGTGGYLGILGQILAALRSLPQLIANAIVGDFSTFDFSAMHNLPNITTLFPFSLPWDFHRAIIAMGGGSTSFAYMSSTTNVITWEEAMEAFSSGDMAAFNSDHNAYNISAFDELFIGIEPASSFLASRPAPVFQFTLPHPFNYTWQLNMADFEPLAQIVRWGVLLVFLIGLLFTTRSLIQF
jgi:hypothetical protein